MAGIKEECGVFGIYDLDGGNVVPSIYYGLTSLQHRGQESCGLAVSDTKGERGNVKFHKDLGLVSEVLRQDVVRKYEGDIGIGQVRYSTTGASVAENAQPLVLSYVKGTLALAHNGNLVNTPELKWELIQNGAIFHTTTDSEVIAFHIASCNFRTAVSWKFQSQTRERGFLKRHYATHRNGSIWAIKAAIQNYTLVWVYILQIRLWNNIMVSLF